MEGRGGEGKGGEGSGGEGRGARIGREKKAEDVIYIGDGICFFFKINKISIKMCRFSAQDWKLFLVSRYVII